MRTSVEHHHTILLRTAEQLIARTFGNAFYKHFIRLADATLIGLRRQTVLQSDNLIQTANFHVFGHIIFKMLRRIRPRTFGIFEHKSGIIATFLHQRKRELMVLFRFGMETGEDIGSQSAIGNDTLDSGYPVQIPLTGIFAVHQFQDAGAAALHREVDMLAHIRHLGDHFQRFIAHILRMGSRETDAHARSSFGHRTEQHREGNHFARRLLEPVRVDILPQQGNFLITFGNKVGHFIQNTFHITAAFASACIRHDTVGAEVIASAHDGYKSGNVVAADTRRNHITVSLGRRKVYVDRFLAGLYRGNQLRQRQVSIRTDHQIDMMVRNQIILHPFRHTAQYAYNQGLLLFLQRVEKLQAVQNLLLRIVTDRAGIHKHCVGLFQRFGYRIARHLHHRSDHLTVRHVHLAAISLDKQLLVVISSCGFKVRSR